MSCATMLGQGHFTALEYPGIVRNASKAMAAVGGEEHVPASPDGELLRLALRPGEPYAHALYADAKPSKCMLLRVSRPRSGAPGMGCRLQVMGVVQTMLQFTGMADYQYLPVDTTFTARDYSKAPAENAPERAEPSGVVQPLLCVPPLFAKHDVPFDYAYKQFNFQDPKTKALKTMVVSYYGAIPPPTTPMQEAAGPTSPAARDIEPGAAQHAHAQGMQTAGTASQQATAGLSAADCEIRVFQLLLQRPVWSFPMLQHQLGGYTQHLHMALARHTYRFKTGPWRGLYIRRGYDPRQLPQSKQYQSVTYTLPTTWFDQAGLSVVGTAAAQPAQPAATTGAAEQQQQLGSSTQDVQPTATIDSIRRFAALPTTRTTVLQLCDLQDPEITAILSTDDSNSRQGTGTSPPVPVAADQAATSCHDEYGWLTRPQWLAVRQLVAQHFDMLMTKEAARTQQPQQQAHVLHGKGAEDMAGPMDGAAPQLGSGAQRDGQVDGSGDVVMAAVAEGSSTGGRRGGAWGRGRGRARVGRGGRGARAGVAQQQQCLQPAGEPALAAAATVLAAPSEAALIQAHKQQELPQQADLTADEQMAAVNSVAAGRTEAVSESSPSVTITPTPADQVTVQPGAGGETPAAGSANMLQQLMQQLQLQAGNGAMLDEDDAYELLDDDVQQHEKAEVQQGVEEDAVDVLEDEVLYAGVEVEEDEDDEDELRYL